MEFKDYYAALGVEPDADEKAIKTAYRKLARKYHPEVDNAAAGENVEWHHLFGEETGERPALYYDVGTERLLLRGGAYRVEDAGIVN